MKLAVALITSLALAAPALACPNMDHDAAAPKTADKDKKPAEKKEAPKAEQKPADTAKTKDTKDAQKKTGDKVSLK
jgi:hypothetical protein